MVSYAILPKFIVHLIQISNITFVIISITLLIKLITTITTTNTYIDLSIRYNIISSVIEINSTATSTEVIIVIVIAIKAITIAGSVCTIMFTLTSIIISSNITICVAYTAIGFVMGEGVANTSSIPSQSTLLCGICLIINTISRRRSGNRSICSINSSNIFRSIA